MNYQRIARLFALSLVFLLPSLPACAQVLAANDAIALPADAPSRDQVMTLLDLLQVRRNMQQMMAGMKEGMKASALQGLKRDVRNPSQKQIDKINLVVDTVFEDVQLEDFVAVIIPVYQRHLSKQDIEEMIRFYSSPTGQKVLREQPQMIQESMRASQTVQQAKMDAMMDKIERKIKEASDDDAASTTQPARK